MTWAPGTWMKWAFGPLRVEGAAVICPRCGSGMSIGGGSVFGSCHSIATDGTVSPSVVCHTCSWHTFIRLIGWPVMSAGEVR